MTKPISQRQAREYRRRANELEDQLDSQRRRWNAEYVGGTHLGTLTYERDWFIGRIESARMLGHAVVVTEEGDGKLKFYALPHAKREAR